MDHKNNTISEAFNRGINIKFYYIINPFDSFTDRVYLKLYTVRTNFIRKIIKSQTVSSLSRLAPFQTFRRLMKGKFDACVLCP